MIGVVLYFYLQFKPVANPEFGITFSHTVAASLGFDSKQVYLDMLTDLKPKKIRLMTYWNETEKNQGQFDFALIDEMLTEASNRGVEVILVIGQKQPRWPECHYPDWYKNLDEDKKDQALLNMIQKTVEHFRNFSAIKYWQVENEPYFVFGIDCPKQTRESLRKEIEILRSLDSRPIILTDSGEQGNWNYTAGSGADILGVTMYRLVYNDKLGYYKYPIGPWFYKIRAGFLQKFHQTPIVGIELQAEPWLLSGVLNTDVETQKTLMNPKIFQEHIDYASSVGLVDNYLWGVEWWYWMAKRNNDWGMWAKAKELLNN
ncbi:MAG: hypothetical protein A3C49_00510 [Candidatus Doudnabacteria bacterium RIFCSPHIGHO2_02_FULL_42_25]|uniref:Glycoside hydrolase family 42 N-terminal domain-containing protein n=1 Tax=Candidatus Doudnabacteria bacterium RIFCSPHIGHO2_01_FULL_41_86 TaxID=1817821 RepID=A0A1F5N7L7_9BACT|nr:MAG: hypothetical protein A2717_03550 [Candidatus Doudnabacteria bacterium RIFCSPHIGHO2_01_FULL_41_86]OGE74750.1 MAG: hypothetical protein A3K07_03145 [Candidatus Doudnabacteria bacterium RIFCSPHIGHO2_01_43_10]OGE85717.1 MAG: hypothetical protein A3E28_02880 [Candidatus Doudnabacteria bacterium RIFCSPHIGHO2_12_FULL_42_22]OGE87213.1 MAG: hypothetical protein A3C49_00510 [Candidatus Doudnabacteria bacterium RIFCSPHIGHO2_02_FULL_42_25]OGE92050.1 MAG: hypothetical protein A2895_00385 [Candidatus